MNRLPLLIGFAGFALGVLNWLAHRGDEPFTRTADGGWRFHPRPTIRGILIFFASVGLAIVVSAASRYRGVDELGIILFGALFGFLSLWHWPRGLVVDKDGMRQYMLFGKMDELKWSEYVRLERKRISQHSSPGWWFYSHGKKMLVWDAAYDTDTLLDVVEQVSGKSFPRE